MLAWHELTRWSATLFVTDPTLRCIAAKRQFTSGYGL
jgi:hypothetical protein